ncbi:MAG: DivIVA domain-containing protein [Candidatus Methylomirabilales bacterium]
MRNLSPLEIAQREFRRRFRGLDPLEVRSFLEGVAEQLQGLLKENILKEEQIHKLETELGSYRGRENELKDILFALQRMGDEMKDQTRKEANLIIKEAEIKAEELLERAHLALGRLQGKIAELKRQKVLFEARMRGTIKLYEDFLDSEAAEDVGEPGEPKPPGPGA